MKSTKTEVRIVAVAASACYVFAVAACGIATYALAALSLAAYGDLGAGAYPVVPQF